MLKKSLDAPMGLYIHIPFCLKKCPYCAFNSYAGLDVPERYISALEKEMEWVSDLFGLGGQVVDSIYLGGGTPSMLSPPDLDRLLRAAPSMFKLEKGAELTMEVNPATVNIEKLEGYREAGINRISIGIQSLNDNKLGLLGRLHSASEAAESFRMARDCGYKNITVDLMAGLPGETLSELKSDLKEIVKLSPDHISLYLLNIEKGTDFFEKREKGELVPADEDRQRDFFLLASKALREEGYLRYETSNYARPGFESRHNLKYWTGADYIGLGAGAHSYLSKAGWGLRWWNRLSPSSYCDDIEAGRLPLEDSEILGREEALSEAVLTSLRTREGLKKIALEERFGTSAFKALAKRAEELVPEDLIIVEAERIALTDKGALMADEIAVVITGL